MPRQWDTRLDELGLYVKPAPNPNETHFVIVAAWLGVNGSAETWPPWAKSDQWDWNNLGGDHHAYGMCKLRDGSVSPDAGFELTWPDGGYAKREPEANRWANFELYADYNWREVSGPYDFNKYGNAETLCGLGLPWPRLPWEEGEVIAMGGCHVSFFVVWQEVAAIPYPTPSPSPEPPDDGLVGCLRGLLRTVAEYIASRL